MGRIVFVFESNKTSKSDYYYVRTFLGEFYDSSRYKPDALFAGSKTKLYSSKTKRDIEEIRNKLGSDGQILVRASGTEPLVRVMVEAENDELCHEYVYSVINKIKDINPDLIVVAAYGKILPLDILNIPKLGCVNIHGSLLPKYRGAAPMQYALMNNEKETGFSLMEMTKDMDAGRAETNIGHENQSVPAASCRGNHFNLKQKIYNIRLTILFE